jgi:hypothetical protein
MKKKYRRHVERTLIKKDGHIKIRGNIEEVDEAVQSLLKCDSKNPWRLSL